MENNITTNIYVVKQRLYTPDRLLLIRHDSQMNAAASQQSDTKNKVSIAVGKRLKKLRIDAEKTQEELAFDSNVDKTFISAIERGVANPSVLTLANICHGLGITLEELFQSIALSMKPTETQRRSNMAQPELKPKRPRLR